jgi:WD40 repeat protein
MIKKIGGYSKSNLPFYLKNHKSIKNAYFCGNGLGHSQIIIFILYLNENELVTCSKDGVIILWDIEKKTPIYISKLPNNSEPGCSVFSQKHQLIYIGDSKGFVSIWNPKKLSLVKKIKIHSSNISFFELNEDENILISSYDTGHIKKLDLETFTQSISSEINIMAKFIKLLNKNTLFTIDTCSNLRIFNIDTGNILAEKYCKKIKVYIDNSDFSTRLNQFFIANYSEPYNIKIIKITNKYEFEECGEISSQKFVRTIAIPPDQNTIFFLKNESIIESRDIKTHEIIKKFQNKEIYYSKISFSLNSKQFSVIENGMQIGIYSYPEFNLIKKMGGYQARLTDFIVFPKKNKIFCMFYRNKMGWDYENEDNNVYCYSLDDLTLIKTLKNYSRGLIQFFSSSDEKYFVVISTKDRKMDIWNVDNLEIHHSFEEHRNFVDFTISPDEKFFVTSLNGGGFRLYDIKSGEKISGLPYESTEYGYMSICFGKNINHLITISQSIQDIDIIEKKQNSQIKKHSSGLRSFCKVNNNLFLSLNDGKIIIIDTLKMEIIDETTLKGYYFVKMEYLEKLNGFLCFSNNHKFEFRDENLKKILWEKDFGLIFIHYQLDKVKNSLYASLDTGEFIEFDVNELLKELY